MAKSMTIEQVKKAKMDLELSILEQFKIFEKDTELKIGYINVKRKRPKENSSEDECDCCVPYDHHKGPLSDVEIDVNLDLVY